MFVNPELSCFNADMEASPGSDSRSIESWLHPRLRCFVDITARLTVQMFVAMLMQPKSLSKFCLVCTTCGVVQSTAKRMSKPLRNENLMRAAV